MRFPSQFDQASFSLEDLLSSTPPGELLPLLDGSVQVNEAAGISPTPTNYSDQAQLTLGTTPAKQKKKRVRREVRELKYLREQARELEVRLEQLKMRVPASGGLASGRTSNTDVTTPSVWEKIAQRQLKERLHVEHIQDELKAECTAHAKLVLDLVKRLKLCGNDARVCAMVRQKPARLWDLFSTDTDTAGIFAEQLTQVSKAYLKMQQQCFTPSETLQLTTDLSQGVEVVRPDPNVDAGAVLEMRCSTTVPFDLQVAGNAYWRMSAYEAFHRQGSVQQDWGMNSDVVSTPFALRVNCDGFTASVRGMQTCRRYIHEDSEIIVWAGYADPVEFNGAKFSGMQCRKIGWIKLQRVPGQPTISTAVEMYSEMTPVFQDGVKNENGQIRALVDSMGRAHNTTNSIYCQMIRELLLEEDWKATYGNDDLSA